MKYPYVSIIIPVKNGGKLLKKCLKSISKLNYPKNRYEVLIPDGRSTDDTLQTCKKYNAKVVDNPKTLVVSGRNIGFYSSKGELVAFSDADCTFDKNWLINSIKYFNNSKVGGISGPNLIPNYEKPFGKAVGIIFNMAFSLNAGSPTSQYDHVIESRSHGSNAIYRREALSHAMPVDEGMVEGEDVLMTESIENAGYKLLYVPDVKVIHFRRTTPDRWLNQMVRYAQAKILLMRRGISKVTLTHHIIGYFIPINTLLMVSILFKPAVIFLYMSLSLFSLLILFFYAFFKSKSVIVSFNFIYATIIMLYAWSYGYMRELLVKSGKKITYKS